MAPTSLSADWRRELIVTLAEEDPFCPEPPAEAAEAWTEERIRAFFQAGGADACEAAVPVAAAQAPRKYPPPDADEFSRWFPGLERSKTRVEAPRMRLICFTNAGNEENVFTNEGLGPRRVAVLLEWCRANKVELLAPQLPGRGARSKEPFLSDAQTAAAHVLRMLATRLDGVPYCVIGHSVGTWIAYEMLALAREQGLPMPLKVRQQAADVSLWLRSAFKYSVTQVFFSCFPPPDIAMSERPWKPQRGLADEAFKTECRGWDVSEALFADAGLWAQYVALLRADFALFDEYEFRRAGQPRFTFPVLAFHAEADRKVSPALVARWANFTSGEFSTKAIRGHHLFVMAMGEQRAAKEAWLTAIVAELQSLSL